MKSCIILVIFVGLTFAADNLSTRINVTDADVDMVLNNRRILTSYIRCLLGDGACPPPARELRKVLPQALKNECNQCDSQTKKIIEKVINHLRTMRKNDWDKLLARYDPKGIYQKRFESRQTIKST